jgi:hypothetical protein
VLSIIKPGLSLQLLAVIQSSLIAHKRLRRALELGWIIDFAPKSYQSGVVLGDKMELYL